MRRIDIITATIAVSALMALASCEKHQEILFDTPFVRISDETGTSSSMNVSNSANNYLTSLRIDVNISGEKYIGDVTIEYEVIAGNGLREGVDYVIQSSTLSLVVFTKGTYTMPVRLLWKHNPDFDPEKDNTLVIRLTSSSMEEMLIGYPGPSALKSSFTFTKQ